MWQPSPGPGDEPGAARPLWPPRASVNAEAVSALDPPSADLANQARPVDGCTHVFTLALLTGVQLPFWQRHWASKDVQTFCVWLLSSARMHLGTSLQCVP